MYDYLIVGAGLFGAVFAHEASKYDKSCLVIDKRSHIAGNIYTEQVEGINIHKYGAHIFHTSDKEIWDYINQFAEFNNYINSPVAVYNEELYALPFNMHTFSKMWGIKTPNEAKAKIADQIAELNIGTPKNLEEQALKLVGTDVYEKLIKGYTEKQWGRPCNELPAFIIKRLPLRFRYDNNYFNDRYQGIPIGGYTQIIEKMLANAEIKLNTDYFEFIKNNKNIAKKTVFTGAIDEFFGYKYGALEYRSLRFETEILNTKNYQGNAVVNYTHREIPYTRIIEHKHFEFGEQANTVISREYPLDWKQGTEPYYPVNNDKNNELYEKYKKLASECKNVIFGGRLGLYQYLDMDKVIASALKTAAKVIADNSSSSLRETNPEIIVSEEIDENKETAFWENIRNIKIGFDIANKYLIADPGIHYFIKDKHLGDAARTLPLISLFKNYHTTNKSFPIKKLVVITTAPIASLAKHYPDIDQIIVLPKNHLMYLEEFLQSQNFCPYIYYMDDSTVNLNMKTMYKLPAVTPLPNEEEFLRCPHKLKDDSTKMAMNILKSHNTIPSKTVILIPKSYSSSDMSDDILYKAIEYFNNIGYTVFTNSAKIARTYKLDCLPDIVVALGALGCLMIGVQSGLMDTMKWMRMNINLFIIFLLKQKSDILFCNNRRLTKHITNRETTVYIVESNPEEENNLSQDIIQQSKYYIKGSIAKNDFLPITDELSIYSKKDLNDYISNVIKLQHIVIFISVCDSANKFWNKFESRHLLGLKEDLSKVWRLSYLAVIDKDNNICKEMLSNKWDGVNCQYTFADTADSDSTPLLYGNQAVQKYGEIPKNNNCWIYSCAMDIRRYTKSSIVINGVDYSQNKRGLNIVIYDKEKARVIDSITVDAFADPNLTVKRRNDFKKIHPNK